MMDIIQKTKSISKKPSAPINAELNSKKLGIKKVSIIVGSLVIIAGGILLYVFLTSPMRTIDKSGYQALFLTNNQVYFGKITGITKDYVALRDIFYLQTQQSVQSTTSPDGSVQSANNNGSNQKLLSLAKLGNEIHGPKDAMYVPRDQILYWENLNNSGRVAKAISDYKNSQH